MRLHGVRGEGSRLTARPRIAVAVDEDIAIGATVLREAEHSTIRELHDLVSFRDGVSMLRGSSSCLKSVSPRLVETSVHWLQAHGTRLTQGVKPRVHSRLNSFSQDKSPCNKRASEQEEEELLQWQHAAEQQSER